MTEPWWISIIKAFLIINLVMLAFAYTTLLERKLLGRMQLRYGPNRAGPYGSLQPIADLIKLIRKESFFPASAIDLPYIVAPVVSMFTALAAFSVIPFGAGWHLWRWHVDGQIANVSIALILVFALGSTGIYGFIVGGWASESKFSLLGSMRTCAQLVSYEVSLALSVLGVVLMGQSLNLVDIVDKQQATLWFFLPQFVGLCVFLLAFAILIFYLPNVLSSADNYIPANPMVTPNHIVPEWYLLPYYAILRSITFDFLGIPSKLLGVLLSLGSLVILFFVPWLDTSRVRSARFRPIYRLVSWILPVDVIALGWVGSQPPAGIVVTVGQIATFYYFFHFLVLMPLLGKIERPRPLPISIGTAVLEAAGRLATTGPAERH